MVSLSSTSWGYIKQDLIYKKDMEDLDGVLSPRQQVLGLWGSEMLTLSDSILILACISPITFRE